MSGVYHYVALLSSYTMVNDYTCNCIIKIALPSQEFTFYWAFSLLILDVTFDRPSEYVYLYFELLSLIIEYSIHSHLANIKYTVNSEFKVFFPRTRSAKC